MKRILTIALAVIGAWVLVSFGGAMLDTVRADFWTQSLMWSLVTTLVLGPLVIMLSANVEEEAPVTQPSPSATPEGPSEQEPAFVSDEANRRHTLWPEDAEEKKTA